MLFNLVINNAKLIKSDTKLGFQKHIKTYDAQAVYLNQNAFKNKYKNITSFTTIPKQVDKHLLREKKKTSNTNKVTFDWVIDKYRVNIR